MFRGNVIAKINVLYFLQRRAHILRFSTIPVPPTEISTLESEKPQCSLSSLVIPYSRDIYTRLPDPHLSFTERKNIHCQQKIWEQYVKLPRLS